MAVCCSRCARQYDVTLFELGRTIWCTCGARVGLGPQIRTLGDHQALRFFADAMLGKVAKWLRLLGFDCAYESDIEDGELVRRSIAEERVVLTRDRALPSDWQIEGVQLLAAETTLDQLAEVIRVHRLADSIRLFSRCSTCNRKLREVIADDLADRLPPRVLARSTCFRECPRCCRVYWDGSHAARISRIAERILEDANRSHQPRSSEPPTARHEDE